MSLTNALMIPNETEMVTMERMAKTLAASGMIPSHLDKQPMAVFAIIQKGRELGVPPMYAMNNINVIKGKAAANSELMAALIYRDHGDEALHFAHTDEHRCEIRYKRRGGTFGTYVYTMEEAIAAGHPNGPNGAMWKKFPANMLRARCVTAVARMAFPDSIGGMYTPEELDAPINEDGEVIHEAIRATVTPLREVPPPPPARAESSSLPVTRGGGGPLGSMGSTGKASAGEIQFLWTTANNCGVTKDEVRGLLAAMFPDAKGIDGQPSTRELTSEQVAQLVATIEETQGTPEDEDEYAEVAAATDQGKLLPIDGGR